MLAAAIPNRATFERTVERAHQAARTLRIHKPLRERRRLLNSITRKPALAGIVDDADGYAMLPAGSIDYVPEAVAFAQGMKHDRLQAAPAGKKSDYNPTILNPKRYEDSPAFFDLILSDDVLQIASDYLGEIPVLVGIRLWWTHVNDQLKGSQLYHRDGQRWLLRRAKFLFNMSDVDSECGPFTFLPAPASQRISESLGSIRGRVSDTLAYRHARPSDAISLVGPAGTGAMVDSSRCYHFGARVRNGERLLLQFQFLRLVDALQGGSLRRSPGFEERFGDDPVRKLVVPNQA